MSLFLSMATSGPEWMFFLLPVIAILLVVEGSKRLYKHVMLRLSRPQKIKISNFTPDDFDDQLN